MEPARTGMKREQRQPETLPSVDDSCLCKSGFSRPPSICISHSGPSNIKNGYFLERPALKSDILLNQGILFTECHRCRWCVGRKRLVTGTTGNSTRSAHSGLAVWQVQGSAVLLYKALPLTNPGREGLVSHVKTQEAAVEGGFLSWRDLRDVTRVLCHTAGRKSRPVFSASGLGGR